jgi:hypothetical protein
MLARALYDGDPVPSPQQYYDAILAAPGIESLEKHLIYFMFLAWFWAGWTT